MNNTRDTGNNLHDSSGNRVGTVGYDGSVRDGYRDKGKVTDDGKYMDEYGRDQGWVVQGSPKNSSNDIGGGGGLTFILLGVMTLGLFWVLKWATASRKRALTLVFLIILLWLLGTVWLAFQGSS